MTQELTRNVIVIISAGGKGLPLACSLSSGRHLLLADNSPTTLSTRLTTLQDEGHAATSHALDISSYTSVQALAYTASSLGPLEAIVHTAGIAPGGTTTTMHLDHQVFVAEKDLASRATGNSK